MHKPGRSAAGFAPLPAPVLAGLPRPLASQCHNVLDETPNARAVTTNGNKLTHIA